MRERVPTYWSYLKLEELLSLQSGLDQDESDIHPDELHFILVHQTLELWLKLILSELRLARNQLEAANVPEQDIPNVVHHMRRIIEILKHSVNQFDVVETLTARDFLSFRDKLFPASGFQSFQMREMEILLGLEESKRAHLGKVSPIKYLEELAPRSKGGEQAWSRIANAARETTLRTALHQWLYRTPIHGSTPQDPNDEAVVNQFLSDYLDAWKERADIQMQEMVEIGAAPEDAVKKRFEDSIAYVTGFLQATDIPESCRAETKRVRAAIVFVESYRELPLLAWPRLLLDTTVELEQRLVLFRQRHARMAERIIGRRVGTGGSAGVDYLDKTSVHRIFSDLWAVRTVLLSKEALPPLANTAPYAFAI
ncbi:MAG: tryptophan 2,3-dioxygenase family protein [Myxococcota bacterium]|nr:tryptophan 2,3-dioxygenase family protein [Myxococcota bacterium]